MNTPKPLEVGDRVIVCLNATHPSHSVVRHLGTGIVTRIFKDAQCLFVSMKTKRLENTTEIVVDNRASDKELWGGIVIRYVGDGKLWQRDKYRKNKYKDGYEDGGNW